MAFNCLLGVSFDELHWKAASQDTDFELPPGIPLCDTKVPSAETAGVRGSRYGGGFQPTAEHECRAEDANRPTRGAGDQSGWKFISYYCWEKTLNRNVTNDGNQSFLTSHPEGDGAPDGAVRICWHISFAGENYKPYLEGG